MSSHIHPVHEITEKGQEFLNQLSPDDKELHEMAVKMLKSSYFVEKTHSFEKWLMQQKQTQLSTPNK